jgi:AcrR family transcriptional regulator
MSSESTGGVADAPAPVDRRRLRAEQGRDRVVDAMLELFEAGDPEPGAARIAAAAGVSERSVFRYFDDLESLAAAAVARQTERVRPAFTAPATTGDLDTRIRALVDQRLAIHDRVGAVSRAARRFASRSGSIRDGLARRRRLLRDQVAASFASELDARARRDRAELLDALDAAAGFDQIDQLRTDAGHSRSRVRALTIRTLRALLAEPEERPWSTT